MIFVSHDRMFLRGLSNRVLELGGETGTDREPHVYPGSYVEYVAAHGPRGAGRARVTAISFSCQLCFRLRLGVRGALFRAWLRPRPSRGSSPAAIRSASG